MVPGKIRLLRIKENIISDAAESQRNLRPIYYALDPD
jgi:hypothetical protein